MDEFIRDAALRSLVVLVAADRLTKEVVIEYFKSLFQNKLEREPSQVWNGLVNYASDLRPADLMPEIQRAYEEGLVYPGYISPERIEERLGMTEEAALQSLRKRHPRIVDPVAEMSWWACFQPKAKTVSKAPDGGKAGRNQPCPCGSGKKYKKCCGKG